MSLEWSKKFEVLTISRLYLRELRFSTEALTSLTDENMQRIADLLNEQHFTTAFEEHVRFIVSCEIVEKNARGENSCHAKSTPAGRP